MSSVAPVIFMLVIMPCSVGDYFTVDMMDSYVASRAYVDIMFMHCNWYHVILSWLSIFAFKFNQIKLNLNNYWLSHGAAESS